MKIKFTNHLFLKRIGLLKFMMGTFVFLLCSTAFGFNSSNLFSKNTKVHIDKDQLVSIDEVFDLLRDQTDYSFIYQEGLFNDLPKVKLKKGTILANKLFETYFFGKDFKLDIKGKIVGISATMSSNTTQQKFTVSGIVSDSNGQPLPGASIVEKGTSNGVMTDFDGNYSLKVFEENSTLVISYIGFATQEVMVKGQANITITLIESAGALNEIVVVGYGTQRKEDVTGSITSLGSDDFPEGSQQNVQQLMEGKMAGVSISKNSGKPGGSNTVRIRGGTSISASNDPLYVIDGVPISTSSPARQANIGSGGNNYFDQEPVNPLNSINSNDIESITVLKDASATAIYGSRGANGVIVVTTKMGHKGKLTTDFSASTGFSTVSKKLDILSADEYVNLVNELGLPLDDQGARTNWQDEIFTTGLSQDYNLSLSGGGDASRYRGSLGHSTLEGVVIGSEQSITTTSIGINHEVFDGKLAFDLRMNSSLIEASNAPISNNIGGENGTNMLFDAYVFNPTYPIRDESGNFTQYSQFTVNPVSYANEIEDESNTRSLFGNLSTTYKIIKPLSVNVNLGYTHLDIQRNSYIQKLNPLGEGVGGIANKQNTGNSSKLFETTLRYQDFIGLDNDHSLNAIAGYSYQNFTDEGYRISASGFISDEFKWNSLQAANTVNNVSDYKTTNTLISYYGRINYAFKNRYLLTATLRQDGSSRFGDGNKWGTFPSGSVAWRVSNENFFPEENFINDLKLRLSYGVTGNQEIGNLNSITTLGASTTGYLVGGNRLTVVLPQQYANPNLQWEETAQFDLGLDFQLFKGRMFGVFDYYKKNTSNLLLSILVPSPSVVSTQLANVGEVQNSGIEFTLGGDIIKNQNFIWSANANISSNKNEVISLSNESFSTDEILYGELPSTGLTPYSQLISPGLSLGTFYGLKFTGIENGEEQFEDGNQVIGNAMPDFTFGFNNTFGYKNLDLSFNFRGSVGNDVLNLTALNLSYKGILPAKNILRSAVNDGLDRQQRKTYSSRWIEDGSFIRLNNLTMGYTFNVSSESALIAPRIYVTMENLFVITNYSGQDPEVNSDTSGGGVAPLGIDYLAYPRSKNISIGGRIKF